MGAFMLNFATLLTDLFALKKPVVAAVNGVAVAGGCLLALAADWRVLRRGAAMGLNEVKVGVPLPWSAVMLLKSTVSASAHVSVALLGRNFEGDAAVATGFASEVVEAEAFEATLRERLGEFAEKDAFAFGVTKGYLRGAAVASMRDRETALLDEFLDGWFSEATQARIQQIVASLQAKA
jgi:enoyl-CoA hydratase